jgi:hypothetical protein
MATSKHMTPEAKNAARQAGIKLDKSLWHIRMRAQRLFDDKRTPPDIKFSVLKLLLKMAGRQDLIEPESVSAEPVAPTSILDLLGEE